jgi:hypothetical protein
MLTNYDYTQSIPWMPHNLKNVCLINMWTKLKRPHIIKILQRYYIFIQNASKLFYIFKPISNRL